MSTQEITIPKKAIELIRASTAMNTGHDLFLKEQLDAAKERMERAIKSYELAKSDWDKRETEFEEIRQWLAQIEEPTKNSVAV